MRSDGQEGFIPSGFVYPADNILQNSTKPSAQNAYNAAMNQLNDARQLQNQSSEQIANNEANTCQTHNMQIGAVVGHVGNTNSINDQTTMITNPANNSNNTNQQVQVSQQQQQSIIGASEDLRYHGTELVMLYDYKVRLSALLCVKLTDFFLGCKNIDSENWENLLFRNSKSNFWNRKNDLNKINPINYFLQAQAPDDLSVRRGDWIYADLNNQTVDGWLWAYAPKTRKYGFIPKAYARTPAMTSL